MDMECEMGDVKAEALKAMLGKIRKLMMEMEMGAQGADPSADGVVNEKGLENEMADAQQMGEVETAAEGGGGERMLEDKMPGAEGSLEAMMKAFMEERSSPLDRKTARLGGGGDMMAMMEKPMGRKARMMG